EGPNTSLRRASMSPYGGWMVLDGIPQPSFAVVQEVPTNTWSVAVWSLGELSPLEIRPTALVTDWTGPTQWTFELPTSLRIVRLLRRQGKLTTSGWRIAQHVLDLQSAPDVSDERRVIAAARQAVLQHYPPYRDNLEFRYRNSRRLLLLLVLQEAFFFAYGAV